METTIEVFPKNAESHELFTVCQVLRSHISDDFAQLLAECINDGWQVMKLAATSAFGPELSGGDREFVTCYHAFLQKWEGSGDTPANNPLRLSRQECFACGRGIAGKLDKPEAMTDKDSFWIYAFCDKACAQRFVRTRAAADEQAIHRVYREMVAHIRGAGPPEGEPS